MKQKIKDVADDFAMPAKKLIEILVQLRIQRRVNATDQRGQMRHESQADLVTGCGDV